MHGLVLVNSTGPGAGKSTLAAGLAAALLGRGTSARHLTEADLLGREVFQRCATALAANDPGAVDLFVEAARVLAAEHGDRSEVWIVDALLPGLVWIAQRCPRRTAEKYTRDVAAVFAPLRPLLAHLTGDPGAFLDRALAQRGAAWAEFVLASIARIDLTAYPGGPVHSLAEAGRFFRWQDAEVQALMEGWPGPTLVLDAERMSAEELLGRVMEHLTQQRR